MTTTTKTIETLVPATNTTDEFHVRKHYDKLMEYYYRHHLTAEGSALMTALYHQGPCCLTHLVRLTKMRGDKLHSTITEIAGQIIWKGSLLDVNLTTRKAIAAINA